MLCHEVLDQAIEQGRGFEIFGVAAVRQDRHRGLWRRFEDEAAAGEGWPVLCHPAAEASARGSCADDPRVSKKVGAGKGTPHRVGRARRRHLAHQRAKSVPSVRVAITEGGTLRGRTDDFHQCADPACIHRVGDFAASAFQAFASSLPAPAPTSTRLRTRSETPAHRPTRCSRRHRDPRCGLDRGQARHRAPSGRQRFVRNHMTRAPEERQTADTRVGCMSRRDRNDRNARPDCSSPHDSGRTRGRRRLECRGHNLRSEGSCRLRRSTAYQLLTLRQAV